MVLYSFRHDVITQPIYSFRNVLILQRQMMYAITNIKSITIISLIWISSLTINNLSLYLKNIYIL